MLNLTHIEDELEAMKKYVLQQSKSNLTKGGHNFQKKLYNSLDGEMNVSANSFSLDFLMEEYGVYQDKGVKGKVSTRKAPNSPFRFGSGTGKKGGLTQGIDKWVQGKRIQFRDKESGKFLSYKSTAFLITRGIYNKGIKPTMFFTKPFERAFDNLDNNLIEAFGLDVEDFLNYTLNNIKTNG
jgi:hypothetical protein